jgi:hypothetical protein
MSRECELFMEDPEAHAAHAETCADCRRYSDEMKAFHARFDDIALPPAELAGRIDRSLPVASWEGASYRAWPTVAVAFLALGAVALALAMIAGVSLSAEMRNLFRGWVETAQGGATLMQSLPKLVAQTSTALRVTIIVLFVVINAIFFALLRRAPKGYDAPTR